MRSCANRGFSRRSGGDCRPAVRWAADGTGGAEVAARWCACGQLFGQSADFEDAAHGARAVASGYSSVRAVRQPELPAHVFPAKSVLSSWRYVLGLQASLAHPAGDGSVADAKQLSDIAAGQQPLIGHDDQRTRRRRVARLVQTTTSTMRSKRRLGTMSRLFPSRVPSGSNPVADREEAP